MAVTREQLLAEYRRRGLTPPSAPAPKSGVTRDQLLAEYQRRGITPPPVANERMTTGPSRRVLTQQQNQAPGTVTPSTPSNYATGVKFDPKTGAPDQTSALSRIEDMAEDLDIQAEQYMANPIKYREQLIDIGYTRNRLSALARTIKSPDSDEKQFTIFIKPPPWMKQFIGGVQETFRNPDEFARWGATIGAGILGGSKAGLLAGEAVGSMTADRRRDLLMRAAKNDGYLPAATLAQVEALEKGFNEPILRTIGRGAMHLPEYMVAYGGKADLARVNLRTVAASGNILKRIGSTAAAAAKMTALSPSLAGAMVERFSPAYRMTYTPDGQQVVATLDNMGAKPIAGVLKTVGMEFLENWSEMGMMGAFKSGGKAKTAEEVAEAIAKQPKLKSKFNRFIAATLLGKYGDANAVGNALQSKGFNAMTEPFEELPGILLEPLVERGEAPNLKDAGLGFLISAAVVGVPAMLGGFGEFAAMRESAEYNRSIDALRKSYANAKTDEQRQAFMANVERLANSPKAEAKAKAAAQEFLAEQQPAAAPAAATAQPEAVVTPTPTAEEQRQAKIDKFAAGRERAKADADMGGEYVESAVPQTTAEATPPDVDAEVQQMLAEQKEEKATIGDVVAAQPAAPGAGKKGEPEVVGPNGTPVPLYTVSRGDYVYGDTRLSDFTDERWQEQFPNIPKPVSGKVTVYRGAFLADRKHLNPGDWVTLDKKFARENYAGGRGGTVLSKEVPLSELALSSSTSQPGKSELVWRPEVSAQRYDNQGNYELMADYHKRIVADALASGLPVPAAVLADYPDLAPTPPTPTGGEQLHAGVDPTGFFLASRKAIERWKQGADRAGNVAKYLAGRGIKADEMKWTGLDDLLKDPNRRLTKQEILDYIDQNAVKVEEVQRGDSPEQQRADALEVQFREAASREIGQDYADQIIRELLDKKPLRWSQEVNLSDATRYIGKKLEAAYKERRAAEDKEILNPARHTSYQLPGGRGYRELLMTMPYTTFHRPFRVVDAEGRRAEFATEQEAQDYLARVNRGEADEWVKPAHVERQTDESKGVSRTTFTSSHWSEPNVLVHLRFNERTDADGKKVLFIEEIQSDWHQAGREKGYRGRSEAEIDADIATLKNKGPGGADHQRFVELMDEWADAILHSERVPPAPFSETWHELAFKRAVRWAAENGFDRVAWTTGEQQADRYQKLLKDVTEVRWTYDKNAANGKGAYGVTVFNRNGDVALPEAYYSASELKGVVGKQVAQDIIAGKGQDEVDDQKVLDYPSGLTIGGEGFREFYDQKIGGFADKLSRKFGGKGTGEVDIETVSPEAEFAGGADGNFTAPAIDITPEMRRSVMTEGQSLFAGVDLLQLARDFRAEFGDDLAGYLYVAKKLGHDEDEARQAWREMMGGEEPKEVTEQPKQPSTDEDAVLSEADAEIDEVRQRTGNDDLADLNSKVNPIVRMARSTFARTRGIKPEGNLESPRDALRFLMRILGKAAGEVWNEAKNSYSIDAIINKKPLVAGELGDALERLQDRIQLAQMLIPDVREAYKLERGTRAKAFAEAKEKLMDANKWTPQAEQELRAQYLPGELIEHQVLPQMVATQQDLNAMARAIDQFKEWRGQTLYKAGVTADLIRLLEGKVGANDTGLDNLRKVFGPVVDDVVRAKPFNMKLWDEITQIINIPRTMMSFMDMSAVLRQGAVMTIAHPFAASKAFAKSVRFVLKPKDFADYFKYVLPNEEYYPQMKRSWLAITDPSNANLGTREEAFISRKMHKLPIIGQMIRASERSYVGYLTKMRVDLFKDWMEVLKNDEGFDPYAEPGTPSGKTMEAVAEVVNTFTGRGEFWKKGGNWQGPANALLFSPRLVLSRLRALDPTWYYTLWKSNPAVAKKAIGDMMKYVGVGLTILLLARLLGARVNANPYSSDFGKVRLGNARWDIWGGHQQYVRALFQILGGRIQNNETGVVEKLGRSYGKRTRWDVAIDFTAGKFSPVPSLLVDAMKGRTFDGEPFNWPMGLAERVYPLYMQDIVDAAEDNGLIGAVGVGVPSFFGVGTSVYKPRGGSGGLKLTL